MTKEELKQEAEQDAGNASGFDLSTSLMVTKNKTDAYRLGRFDGYLSGAEPREKRIAELEKKNRELEDRLCNVANYLLDSWCRNKDDYCPHLAKLEKENAELIQENEEMKKGLGCETCQIHLEYMRLNNRIADLEKENAESKCECRTCVYTDSPCVLSDYPSKDGVCSHYKNVFDENVELKKENKVLAQNLEDTEILNKTYEKRFSDLEKENAELDCQKNRNKFCYSCANATERCFRNEIGCPCEKYKSYKEENAKLKTDYEVLSCSVGDFGELQNKLEEEQRKNNGLSDNLTKAKEIIKKFLLWENDWHDKTESKYELLKQAEQFLKDCEVEK